MTWLEKHHFTWVLRWNHYYYVITTFQVRSGEKIYQICFLSISKPLFILSPHYLNFSNSLFIWKVILFNTTLYFIFIFIKIIFLLFYLNFYFSLLDNNREPPRLQNSTTTENHAQASHEDNAAGRDPRPDRDPRSRDRRNPSPDAVATAENGGDGRERGEQRTKREKKIG